MLTSAPWIQLNNTFLYIITANIQYLGVCLFVLDPESRIHIPRQTFIFIGHRIPLYIFLWVQGYYLLMVLILKFSLNFKLDGGKGRISKHLSSPLLSSHICDQEKSSSAAWQKQS